VAPASKMIARKALFACVAGRARSRDRRLVNLLAGRLSGCGYCWLSETPLPFAGVPLGFQIEGNLLQAVTDPNRSVPSASSGSGIILYGARLRDLLTGIINLLFGGERTTPSRLPPCIKIKLPELRARRLPVEHAYGRHGDGRAWKNTIVSILS